MSEDFLTRWARLKRESALRPTEAAEAAHSEPAPADSPVAPPVDVSSLPAVESISAESRVAAFLQEGVPEDLKRSALRTAWTSDPAIRDFVGIAENQWDFNGEGAIAGFGSLSAEEYARYLAARALQGEQDALSKHGGEIPVAPESTGVLPSSDTSDNTEMHSTAVPELQTRPTAQESVNPSETATSSASAESPSASPRKRSHGSALPK